MSAEPPPHSAAPGYRPGRRTPDPRYIEIPELPHYLPFSLIDPDHEITSRAYVPPRDMLRLPMAHRVARRRISHTLRGHIMGALALMELLMEHAAAEGGTEVRIGRIDEGMCPLPFRGFACRRGAGRGRR